MTSLLPAAGSGPVFWQRHFSRRTSGPDPLSELPVLATPSVGVPGGGSARQASDRLSWQTRSERKYGAWQGITGGGRGAIISTGETCRPFLPVSRSSKV